MARVHSQHGPGAAAAATWGASAIVSAVMTGTAATATTATAIADDVTATAYARMCAARAPSAAYPPTAVASRTGTRDLATGVALADPPARWKSVIGPIAKTKRSLPRAAHCGGRAPRGG